ncbi:MAG: DUF4145 domain-containing protein [Eubacteriales bacterium]|nr:DUF4145 domain-containing protein [Eubacteriales bacterium]
MAGTGIDIKEMTDNGLEEASGLISRREYNLSIVRSRQTAEMIIKSYASEKNIEYTTLADTIEALYKEGIINRTSRDAFHNIRILGNKAVHERDDDAEDAQKSYYLLKNEVRTFMSRKTVSVDRTPIKVEVPRGGAVKKEREVELEVTTDVNEEREAEPREKGSQDMQIDLGALKQRRRSGDDRGREGSSSGGRRKASSGGSGRRQNTSGGQRRKASSERRPSESGGAGRRQREEYAESAGGFSIYDILRILIPVIAVILLIIIIRSLIPAKKQVETTTEAQTQPAVQEVVIPETTAAPETEPVTEPPVYEYRIKGDGINIRYADNQNRIYTQLSNGTAIGTVEPIDGSDFVAFTLDGVNVVVKKDFIEPIQ